MIKAGVIGHPVAHSLSPKLHGYWLKKYGIDGEYKAYDVAPEHLASFIQSLPETGFAGCNVTIPHKEKAFELLKGRVDEAALRTGAVNTIIVEDTLIGMNTDVYGFEQNIAPHIIGKNKAVVLGAGGAANAVWEALVSMGFKEVALTNRTHQKICDKECMLDAIVGKKEGAAYSIHEWDNRDSLLEGADLLVNATSLGMVGKEPLNIDLRELPKTALVTDIVYNPLITPLLAAAGALGLRTVDGLGMLLHQAAPAFAAWFGVMPEVNEELREFVLC